MSKGKETRAKIWLILGLFFAISSLASYLGLPLLIQCLIKKELILSDGSASFQNWREIQTPIEMRVHLFNLTNPTNFSLLGDRPKLKELGPFTFLERRKRVNISWNAENGTVAYREMKTFRFLPHLSNGILSERIVQINPTMIATSNDIRQRGGHKIMYETINAIIISAGLRLYPTHTVDEILFNGYPDDLLYAAKQLGMDVPFVKFGWFYARNGTISKESYRIFTGQADTLEQFGFIDTLNNQKKLNTWDNHACDSFERSTPGDFQPPFAKRDAIYRLLLPDLCRTIDLTFAKEIDYKGLKLHRFWLSEKVFDYSIEQNKCYCDQDRCPLKGLFNASKCSQGTPIFVSLPHFLYADERLTSTIDDLQPDPEKHIFYIDIEPNLGIPVRVRARIQINMLMERDENLVHLEDLHHQAQYLPIFWTETSVDLDDEMLAKLKIIQKLPTLIFITSFVQLSIAAVILITTFACALRSKTKQNEANKYEYSYETVKLSDVQDRIHIRSSSNSKCSN